MTLHSFEYEERHTYLTIRAWLCGHRFNFAGATIKPSAR